ncbi:MAG: alpha/beta fold hydrolase [Anaerolineae bacterium]|nr:alpha/beta fold hydrolase [Anaerolineae bacterium]
MWKRIVLTLLGALISASSLSAASAMERPDAPKYGKRGAYAVGTRELSLESLPNITIWYPAQRIQGQPQRTIYQYGPLRGEGRAYRDGQVDRRGAPYPLIIFSHGLGGARLQSVFYAEHLASHGFVVIAADHPGSAFGDLLTGRVERVLESFARRPLEVLSLLEYAVRLNAEDEMLRGAIDTETVGVTGHSFGGYTALSAGGAQLNINAVREGCEGGKLPAQLCLYVQSEEIVWRTRGLSAAPQGLYPPTTDPRIKAVVALAPSSAPLFGAEGAAALRLPLMIIVGSQDRATPPERDSYPIYDAVSSVRKALVVFENAGHYIFVEQCVPALIALGRFEQCSDLVWDMQRAHDLINHFATAFFLTTLKGDAEARAALDPTAVNFVGIAYKRDGAW